MKWEMKVDKLFHGNRNCFPFSSALRRTTSRIIHCLPTNSNFQVFSDSSQVHTELLPLLSLRKWRRRKLKFSHQSPCVYAFVIKFSQLLTNHVRLWWHKFHLKSTHLKIMKLEEKFYQCEKWIIFASCLCTKWRERKSSKTIIYQLFSLLNNSNRSTNGEIRF